ncbi:unnamed protein product [Amoebophrya sp. A120]|nr:unnamed protein product [Amoebophrya sp. A120]|eukprot:GSA120T00017988001.1
MLVNRFRVVTVQALPTVTPLRFKQCSGGQSHRRADPCRTTARGRGGGATTITACRGRRCIHTTSCFSLLDPNTKSKDEKRRGGRNEHGALKLQLRAEQVLFPGRRAMASMTARAKELVGLTTGGTSSVGDVAPSDAFGPANLPYGVFSTTSAEDVRGRAVSTTPTRIGVAIGSKVLDCQYLARTILQARGDGAAPPGLATLLSEDLQAFMSEGKAAWDGFRALLQQEVFGDEEFLASHADKGLLIDRTSVQMHLPCRIGDYTDFYASRDHATNVGKMFRDPENALLPNWLHLPVGYHGRASSVKISGTPVVRPSGQVLPKDAPPHGPPEWAPSKLIDYELEVGAFIGGKPMALGETLSLQEAEERLFGLVLLNDWSARDLQKWEYVPLGPFLAKNFGTIISPWIVPMAALEPYRVPTPPQTDPLPLPYLRQPEGARGNFDVRLTAEIAVPTTDGGLSETVVTRTNLKYMYWSLAQQLTHHASNGCNMQPGDLIGTGTISGPEKSERGCLLELTWAGRDEVALQNGDVRKFLKDRDAVVLRGTTADAKVGFGSCSSQLLPARAGSG